MSLNTVNNRPNKFSINKEFDADILLVVLRKHWLVFPILISIAFAAGYLYLRYTKPVYSSSAIIQRSSQDEGKRILDTESFENEGSLSEDVELLRSTFLLEKALRNLNLNISYYSEGEILTEEKYLMSSYHITLLEVRDSSLIGIPIHLQDLAGQCELSFIKDNKEFSYVVEEDEILETPFFSLIFKINDRLGLERSINENALYLL